MITPHIRRFLVLVLASTALAQESPLQPLAYNNTGLVVDLGIGLWAWPIPWDVDGDGDTDLLVSCPDKPSNGVWLFENQSGPGAEMPVFAPGRRLGPTQHYVTPSYADGTLRVLRTSTEWPDVARTGLTPGRDVKLPLPVTAHTTLFGTQPKGQRIRHNVWKYVDFDGDVRRCGGSTDVEEGAVGIVVAVARCSAAGGHRVDVGRVRGRFDGVGGADRAGGEREDPRGARGVVLATAIGISARDRGDQEQHGERSGGHA